MGDKLLEQCVVLSLKHHFFRPLTYKSPIENSFYIGRALADLTDRHYSLFANNQHPMQLDIYENYNKMLRIVHSEEHKARILATHDRFNELVDEKNSTLNSEEGEKIGWDDYQDLYI